MSLDVFIGVVGAVVTVLVVAAMILITPRGAVPQRAADEPRRANGAAAPGERAVR
jgi:hypothetical protein